MKKYLGWIAAFKIVKYIVIAAFFLNSSESSAQVTLSADTGRIGWGERVTITAEMGVNASDNIISLDSFPQWTDSIPGGLEVVEILGPDTIPTGDDDPTDWDFIIRKSWVVTAWDSGFVDLPGLQIQKVPTQAGDQLEIHAEIIEVKWTTAEKIKRILPYLFGLIALLIAIGIAVYLLRKLRTKPLAERVEKEIILPPHIIAIQKLEELKQRESWLKGDEKTFQVDLSKIIREYIDGRFGVRSLDKTSSEAALIIKHLDISEGDKVAIRSALMLGDQIKFAKFKAAHDMHLKSLNDCIEFVHNTKEDEVA